MCHKLERKTSPQRFVAANGGNVNSWGYQLGRSSKNLFRQVGNQVLGKTHGDDFVLTGPTQRLTEFENKMTGVSNQSNNHQLRVLREHQSSEQKVAWEKAREWIISTIPDMPTGL